MSVFDPSMSSATIQSRLNQVFGQQSPTSSAPSANALLFKPGSYNVDANVGFYTQVAGLGLTPDAVTINGAVHAEADWFQGNATQNFWRSAENLSVNPNGGSDRWAVSQAPRTAVCTYAETSSWTTAAGRAAGSWPTPRSTARCGPVRSSSGSRATASGAAGTARTGTWSSSATPTPRPTPSPARHYTTVAQSPRDPREAVPVRGRGGRVQGVRARAAHRGPGHDLGDGTPAGTSLPIDQFYVVKPGATAADINGALAQGKKPAVHTGRLPPEPGPSR
ncbi:hypothetical protein ACFH04_41960 [Streptomyces noboritoensis]|uniref:Uncharacterized protein n=1 Tax=Streptomyces noboritoensis TaxID=67337 RepID=A0ABV6TWT8_9ACTN